MSTTRTPTLTKTIELLKFADSLMPMTRMTVSASEMKDRGQVDQGARGNQRVVFVGEAQDVRGDGLRPVDGEGRRADDRGELDAEPRLGEELLGSVPDRS